MGIIYTPEQRENICKSATGKTIESLSYDEDGYWVAELSDGTEFCFRFMAELV